MSLFRRTTPALPALPQPGPKGRILFVGPFNGGIGGIERLTKHFAQWIPTSGFTAVMMLENPDFPQGPYSVSSSDRICVLSGAQWNEKLTTEPFDFVYVMPPGLGATPWIERLKRIKAPKVVLDLDAKRRYLEATDVYHCESPRANVPPRPFVVSAPDPRSTIPQARDDSRCPDVPFHLSVFTPYGSIKGHRHLPAFIGATEKPLVWCYDTTTFKTYGRSQRKKLQRYLNEFHHERLLRVEAPTQDQLYSLYERCAGYVCFSDSESLGFSLLDTLVMGRPLCSGHVGICRSIDGFEATTDFAAPAFKRYNIPPFPGYDFVFEEARRKLAGSTA